MNLEISYYGQDCINKDGFSQLYSTDKARLLFVSDSSGRMEYLMQDPDGTLFLYRDPRRAKEKKSIRLMSFVQASEWTIERTIREEMGQCTIHSMIPQLDPVSVVPGDRIHDDKEQYLQLLRDARAGRSFYIAEGLPTKEDDTPDIVFCPSSEKFYLCYRRWVQAYELDEVVARYLLLAGHFVEVNWEHLPQEWKAEFIDKKTLYYSIILKFCECYQQKQLTA